jgi:signal recognition particle subunit SRP54
MSDAAIVNIEEVDGRFEMSYMMEYEGEEIEIHLGATPSTGGFKNVDKDRYDFYKEGYPYCLNYAYILAFDWTLYEVTMDYPAKYATIPVRNAIKEAKAKSYNLVIIDTAGRLAVDEAMMNEIAAIKEAVKPTETLFVVDSMTGQDAVNTAKEFNDRLDFTGVILTKLDGDTRGGAALSIRTVVTKPIKFIGTGEKMEAIDQFHPNRMADRILGMGDVVSLVERAQEQFDEEEAKKLQRKLARNQFDFNDFLTQIQQIKKMGNIKDLMAMIPGVGKALKDVDMDNDSFKGIEAIILSMTPQEREHPEIINGSRRKRIADGSGTSLQDVNKLLKQFDAMRKMMKQLASGNIGGFGGKMLAKKFAKAKKKKKK